MRTDLPTELELTSPTSSTDRTRLVFTDEQLDRLVDYVSSKLEPTKQLMTKKDVATYLNVSIRTVDTLIAEGELIPIKIRTSSRFTYESVERYIHRRR